LEGEEVAAKIREILLAIPDNQRTAILLSRQEGMSYQEVAAVIGCTEKAVKSLVFRATQSLKAGLQDMGDEDDT
jgi:RNA polymerase sigma-70 factor (ECF subfamily)